ncbi:MAG: hypothetical protein ABIA47_01220 [bacterium]
MPNKKISIGWFSYACCNDSTIVFTELLNDHWKEWKEIFDFRHVEVLQKENKFDKFDIVFIEGAITTKEQKTEVMKIRKMSKKLVAVGACAVVGAPANQRNRFSDEEKQEIEFLLARFKALDEVLKVSDVVKVDAEVPGCPMDPIIFLRVVSDLVNEFKK